MLERRREAGGAARPKSRESAFTFRARAETLERRILLAALSQSDTAVSFLPGDMTADPVRDAVYVIDATHDKVLAIDADLGRVVSQALLDSPAGQSHLAVAPAGDRLFVSQPMQNQIEVL